ncbi:MAG: SH3 domain-containing protein [Parachlamydiaceae bacterium]|nr:SH3 domain-containing protein [Parachlamydiaceae bacterium]
MRFILPIFIIFCALITNLFCQSFESLAQNAYIELEKGENTESIDQRKINFNQALFLYLQAEQIDSQNPDIDQVIAYIFSQLNEYPLSILYYYRALKHGVDESRILPLLKETQNQAGLSSVNLAPINFLTFFTDYQKNYILFLLLIGIIILFICNTWIPSKWVKFSLVFSLGISTFFLVLLMFSYYTQSLEGVLINASELYDPIHQRNFEDPILAGTKVEILELISNEDWIKIKDSENRMGFISLKNIKII